MFFGAELYNSSKEPQHLWFASSAWQVRTVIVVSRCLMIFLQPVLKSLVMGRPKGTHSSRKSAGHPAGAAVLCGVTLCHIQGLSTPCN